MFTNFLKITILNMVGVDTLVVNANVSSCRLFTWS